MWVESFQFGIYCIGQFNYDIAKASWPSNSNLFTCILPQQRSSFLHCCSCGCNAFVATTNLLRVYVTVSLFAQRNCVFAHFSASTASQFGWAQFSSAVGPVYVSFGLAFLLVPFCPFVLFSCLFFIFSYSLAIAHLHLDWGVMQSNDQKKYHISMNI